jgi:MoaA/NifB/PqqE/SkfB family radical SAM enzyme
MGSIYKENLSDIVNEPGITRLRRASLEGTLPCYASCNLIDKTGTGGGKYSYLHPYCDYADFKTIYIDFGMKCNISCIMCRQRARYKTDQSTLRAEMLICHIDIRPFSTIFLQGGEPLCIDECLKYMTYLAKNRKKYSLLTNGTLIDESMAARLAREAKLISISLNASTKATHEKINHGSSWEQVLGNIQSLRDQRERFNTDLSINGRMTLTVDALPEIPSFLRSYKMFGFDTVNFGYDRDTVPLYLQQNPEFASTLSHDIAKVMSTADLSTIDSLRLSQLGLF